MAQAGDIGRYNVTTSTPSAKRHVTRYDDCFHQPGDPIMQLSPGEFIVWLIVGGLAGTLAGMLVTLKKEGLGRWTNLGVGMVGALIGGMFLRIFRINVDLGEIKFADLIAAFLGSLLFVTVWWLVAKFRKRRKAVLAD